MIFTILLINFLLLYLFNFYFENKLKIDNEITSFCGGWVFFLSVGLFASEAPLYAVNGWVLFTWIISFIVFFANGGNRLIPYRKIALFLPILALLGIYFVI